MIIILVRIFERNKLQKKVHGNPAGIYFFKGNNENTKSVKSLKVNN